MLILAPVRQQDWSCNLKVNLGEETCLPLSLGRRQELGIPAKETAISRKHAELAKDGKDKICLKALRKVWVKYARVRKISMVAGGETLSVRSSSKAYP